MSLALNSFELLIIFVLAAELFSITLTKWLKKDFQWLITSDDDFPYLDQTSLKKFIENSFDPELGWERKGSMSKREPIKSAGEEKPEIAFSFYSTNAKKARFNPDHEDLPNIISSFGDSFAFSRHVNDNQTWQ